MNTNAGRQVIGAIEQHLLLPTPTQPLEDPWLAERGVVCLVKRDDLMHPLISGNKWRKLKYLIGSIADGGSSTVLSFGGAYSNHLLALAEVAFLAGFESIGVVRGERTLPLNPVLAYCESRGMRLYYVDRGTYRRKHEPAFLRQLQETFGDFALIPVGGASPSALKGVAEMVAEISEPFSMITTAVGTGTTLAGLIASVQSHQACLGVACLKGASFLRNDVASLLAKSGIGDMDNWEMDLDHHFGGFAKSTPALNKFVSEFTNRTGVPIEPVYSGKMVSAVYDRIEDGRISAGQRVVLLHTGGLELSRLPAVH